MLTLIQKSLKSSLWGVSIALSWTWGLGLFFCVQMALQFGLSGLLLFAIPNAIGLFLFGFVTQRVARNDDRAKDFERHFFSASWSLRFIFLLYQFVAIALTFFAIFRYLLIPLGVRIELAVMLVFGAALILGEHFPINKIKFTHLVMFGLILLSMVGITGGFAYYLKANELVWELAPGQTSIISWSYLGFFVPILCGFLVGPWLDLQQWQRAIQIHREKGSIRQSYLFGSMIFFCILVFHGVFALSVMSVGGDALVAPAVDGLFHAKEAVVQFVFLQDFGAGWVLKTCYFTFLALCILTTLDSGYVSLKWQLKELTRKSDHIIFSLVGEKLIGSPIMIMLPAVVVAVVGTLLHWELEYFIGFYGSFSIGYSVVLFFRFVYKPEFTNFSQTTLFSVAAFAVGLFGIGYFGEIWILMALGALVPLVHGFGVISGRVVADDIQKALPRRPDSTDMVPADSVTGKAAEIASQALENAISRLDEKTQQKLRSIINRVEPTAAQALANVLATINPGELSVQPGQLHEADAVSHAKGYFEGKWFCYTFMPTYSDTNSVGNVYFANYLQYVGKVREMFFATAMPDFDLNDTPFFILTRQIEHKFQIEAKEFDIITVKIRVQGFNRKFVTLEHIIINQDQQVLGKGKQILMFVSSSDYKLVDMPHAVHTAFFPYTPLGG